MCPPHSRFEPTSGTCWQKQRERLPLTPGRCFLPPGIKHTFGPNRLLALGLPLGVTADSPAFGVVVQMQFSMGEHREHEQAKRTLD